MISKTLLSVFFVIVTTYSYSQLDTAIYGITRDDLTQELYLSKINLGSSIITNISTTSFTSKYVRNALEIIDPINELFYLISQDTLFGIDLDSGNVVYKSYVSTPISGYFELMNFNCSDSTIYGITRNSSTQELYLSKINPINGIVTNISTFPFSNEYSGNALATIDPIHKLFYLVSQDTLFGIDLDSGNVICNSHVSTQISGYFELMNFNCSDTTIYGITRDDSTQELYLSKINPINGIVTNISTSPITHEYNGNAMATIDPINDLFYLISQDTLLGIDLKSGNVAYKSYVSNQFTGYFELMNFTPTQYNCNTTFGIEPNLNEVEFFSIYPNPTNSILNVKSLVNSEFQVDIYTIDGNLLKSIKSDGFDALQINLNDCKSGILILVIRDNSNTVKFKKIIKN